MTEWLKIVVLGGLLLITVVLMFGINRTEDDPLHDPEEPQIIEEDEV